MLEEILKEISESLKKIASNTAPIDVLVNPSTKNEIDSATVATVIAPVAQPDVEIQQVAQPQVQQPVASIPVIPTAGPTGYTQEQLAVAMSNAVSAGKMNLIQEIMTQFGVQALTQLDPSRYNELAAKLKESGVQI